MGAWWGSRSSKWTIVVLLGAGAVVLPRPWRVLMVLGLVLSLVTISMQARMQASTEMIRRHRHRLANRLQVVGGWLELQHPDRARAALALLTESLSAEGARDVVLPVPWRYTAWEVETQAEAKGMIIDWNITGPPPTGWWAWWMFRTVALVATRLGAGNIAIKLGPTGFTIGVPAPVQPWPVFWGRVKVQLAGDTEYLTWGNSTGPSTPEGPAGIPWNEGR